MLREAAVRTERAASVFRPAEARREQYSGAAHSFGNVLVLAQEEEAVAEPAAPEPQPEPAPEPLDQPTPEPPKQQPPPAQPAQSATATVQTHIRGAGSPAGTPDRIPPRVDTEATVDVAGATPASPVTLSIEGAGGGNGTVTINGAATAALDAAATVKLRGVEQTDDKKAGNLKLVAEQGGTRLAASDGFSVAAWPVEVGMRFFSLMQPAVVNGLTVWGARYDVTVESDSKVRGDLGRTTISESVLVTGATGIFKGAVNKHSGFKSSVAKQRDNHGTSSPDDTAAGLIAAIRKVGIAASKQSNEQHFRFADFRTGIAEDAQKSPKVATSGFKISHRTTASGGKFFMNVTKDGLANNGVAAGAVDDAKEKAAEIRDA